MAKSFASILIGCAIDDGFIKSEYQPVTDYVPELKKNGFDKVQIKHLLQMTSGMDYAEPGFPTGLHSHFYYGDNLEERCLELELEEEPGMRFLYKSGEAQLLGLILSRVIKPRTITYYMQEKLWDPLGMEHDGRWTIDSEENGLEKTFCCIASNARDFSKLGRLYLNKGNWNGKQVVSEEWVNKSTQIDSSDGSAWYYQYQLWIASKESRAFYALGHLGQMMYIDPTTNVIIVRLGKDFDLDKEEWLEIFAFLSKIV
jgi:CubicO group peptidase (beta-lactamase class C family)